MRQPNLRAVFHESRHPPLRRANEPDTPSERPGRVLFASLAGSRPDAALRRAAALAGAVGAELHVLRVLPRSSRASRLFPQLHVVHAIKAVAQALTEGRQAQAWCDEELPKGLTGGRLHVRAGDLAMKAATCALELEAQLVVLPSPSGLEPTEIMALSRAADVPVLMARPPAGRDAILAATDLEDERYPVLRQAAALGEWLDAPVVAVHNATPRSIFAGVEAPRLLTVLPGGRELAERLRQLDAAELRCGAVWEAVVASEVDPADAVLGQARAWDADLIVVGARRRSWLRGLSAEGVAAQIIDRARRSVLVTPLEAP